MNKMIDLGKANEPSPAVQAEGNSAQVKNYPEFHVEHDQLPIDGDHLGKHVHATVKLHVKGVHHDEQGGKRVHFAVKGMELHPGMEDEEGAEHEASESASEEREEHKKGYDRHERIEKIKKDYIKGE